MDINDSGYSVVNMNCFCKGKHCEGNLYIQPDVVDNQKVFMVSARDSSGNEEGSLWLSPEQVSSLIEELKILLKNMALDE